VILLALPIIVLGGPLGWYATFIFATKAMPTER